MCPWEETENMQWQTCAKPVAVMQAGPSERRHGILISLHVTGR